ncbi:MAG: zinc-binding dehydrogenase [Verrucomicrobia bacterium]|nr:zinc-binding dehydrogenase [Verrucomicrobiota bacterium]
MRAVGVVPSRKEVRLIDHAHPQVLSGHEVKVRALEVGICGTDREICTFVYGSPPHGHDYLVLGHESLGCVLEVGDQVTRFKPGDLVVPSVRRPCEHIHCLSCQNDRQDFCWTGDFTERGIKMTHGFMTEFYVDYEKYFTYAPPELREVAVLVEPLTVAEKGMEQLWKVQERLPWLPSGAPSSARGLGKNAVVLGAGPVGILGAMLFKSQGFNTTVYSRSRKPNRKAELVESFGVPYLSSEEVSVEELAERVGNIDVVYEAVGKADISFNVLRVLGMNGAFIFTGIPGPHAPIPVQGDATMKNIVLKNQVMIGTVNADRAAFESAIANLGIFMKRWPDSVRAVITGRHGIDDFEKLLLGKAVGIKNIICLD